MIRTQISLTENEYLAAKREAERLGISLAELLRRSLRAVIPADEAKPWMRYAGMVESRDDRRPETAGGSAGGSGRTGWRDTAATQVLRSRPHAYRRRGPPRNAGAQSRNVLVDGLPPRADRCKARHQRTLTAGRRLALYGPAARRRRHAPG